MNILIAYILWLGDTIVQQAAMWTRKDIQEFKMQVKKEGADTVMKVGHGETVTVCIVVEAIKNLWHQYLNLTKLYL